MSAKNRGPGLNFEEDVQDRDGEKLNVQSVVDTLWLESFGETDVEGVRDSIIIALDHDGVRKLRALCDRHLQVSPEYLRCTDPSCPDGPGFHEHIKV